MTVESSPSRNPAPTCRWRLVVDYDGGGFHGFAPQPGARTVGGLLKEALQRISRLSEAPDIVCAGRTDTGVHARGQIVHVDLPDPMPEISRSGTVRPFTAADLVGAVNRQLAPTIVVRSAGIVAAEFDARRSAIARTYHYLVHHAPVPDPLLAPTVWHVPGDLDLRAIMSATHPIVGEHDFRAFCRRPPGTTERDPIVRKVLDAGWTTLEAPAGGTLLRFEITANAFCHQMVRSIVGLLVAAGQGKGNAASVMEALRRGSRESMPQPAPPHGLCLVRVDYGPGLP